LPACAALHFRRFCDYPQEIGIQFLDGAVAISQIQLLSHQAKIATRIELFTGSGADYFHAAFSRLGYLSLDNNERSQYKVRKARAGARARRPLKLRGTQEFPQCTR
jgi:centrosomal protein CEP104